MVRIIEVGPRDGLQNEPTPIPTETKLQFISGLVDAGLREIEVTSFVSPKWVPQLGDAAELWTALHTINLQSAIPNLQSANAPTPQRPNATVPDTPTLQHSNTRFSALVPNPKGLERALDVGVQRIALFTAASDTFTQKNINMTIEQSLDAFKEVVETFRSKVPNGWIRGYVSTAFECPYAGKITPEQVTKVSKRLLDLGVDEISLGDTIGVAVPAEVKLLNKAISDIAPLDKIAYHFHDTRGTAIANVAQAFEDGIQAFDSSAAGLGGCPYAPGAGGNLATDDLVYFLERSGVATGINLPKLASASLPILKLLGRPPASKAQLAVLARAEAGSLQK